MIKKTNSAEADPSLLEEYKVKIKAGGKNFVFAEEEDNGDEYAHFFFIGMHKGKEVLFDAALYTLRLKYESELYELAEEKLLKQFPEYKKILADESVTPTAAQEEEMGLYMAEVILGLEEDEQVKVQEHIDIDDSFDLGVGLEASLNMPAITSYIIENFVKNFTTGMLKLDTVLYSFESENDEE